MEVPGAGGRGGGGVFRSPGLAGQPAGEAGVRGVPSRACGDTLGGRDGFASRKLEPEPAPKQELGRGSGKKDRLQGLQLNKAEG